MEGGTLQLFHSRSKDAPLGQVAVGKLDCHMQPRRTVLLPPSVSLLPEDPHELSLLAGVSGESAVWLLEHSLFAWLMSPSRRGCKGEAGGNFGIVCLPSEGRGVC